MSTSNGAPTVKPKPVVTDDDHLKLIESDLHFRAKQLRTYGVDTKLVRALMKAAFDRFLIADEGEDRNYQDARPWRIHIGDRDVALRHGDPVLGLVTARTRALAENEAALSNEVLVEMDRIGVPRGTGFWAREVSP